MQCSSYFPGYYPRQDLNGPSNGRPWPVYANDISPNMNAQSVNNFYPSPNVDQMRSAYQNEVLRQTILKHENVFREQVQELHRLHRRQRELMDEFKRRGVKESNIVPASHYNFILSKVSSDCSSLTWQAPTTPTLPWLNPASNNLSTQGSTSQISTFNFFENGSENKELLPKCKKPKHKGLDLELPADEYVDIEKENGIEVQRKSSCSNDKNVNMLGFDLNIPLDMEIYQNLEINNGEKKNLDNTFDEENKKYLFDLNSCVEEEEPSPTILIPKTITTIPKADLEAPISPENKETLPPRGESEENLLEAPVLIPKHEDSDLVAAAAETVLSFNDKKSVSLIESLDWFAGIIISSESTDEIEKEEHKCIVALPSQQGKRQRKRRMNKKICAVTSYDVSVGEKGLKSWGKVNKKRRGTRGRASSVRLLWN